MDAGGRDIPPPLVRTPPSLRGAALRLPQPVQTDNPISMLPSYPPLIAHTQPHLQPRPIFGGPASFPPPTLPAISRQDQTAASSSHTFSRPSAPSQASAAHVAPPPTPLLAVQVPLPPPPPPPPERAVGKRHRHETDISEEDESRGTTPRAPASSSAASASTIPDSLGDGASKPTKVAKHKKDKHTPRIGACGICRRRKLKCDRSVPCTACVSRGEAYECALEAGVVLPQSPRTAHESVPDRLERIELLLTKITERVAAREPASLPSLAKNNNHVSAAASSHGTPALNKPSFSEIREGPPSSTLNRTLETPKRLPSKKRGPKSHALLGLIHPDITPAASNQIRGRILREALELYPDNEAVRTCCTIYFKEAGSLFPVVNETKFWRQFTKHEAFVRRSRDKEIMWSDSLQPEAAFFTLVLAVMILGLSHALDAHLFTYFKERHEAPVSKFLQLIMRLLCALDHHEKPTLDTIRIQLVMLQVLFPSRNSWAPIVFMPILTQDALLLELNMDPPPGCPNDVFYDRINLWTSVANMECIAAVKIGRASMINCNSRMAIPSFLDSPSSWEQASMDGPWSYTQKYRFELSRVTMASMDRDAMSEEDSFACTLALQTRLDTLLEQMPLRLKDALEDPFNEGRRSTLTLIVSRAMHAWIEMFLHGRHYALGWTNSKYSISRRIFYRSALSFISTFLGYWNELIRRVNGTQDLDLNPDTLPETSPGVMFRISPLASAAFATLVQLERHSQLATAYPQVLSEEDCAEQSNAERLVRAMHDLRRRYHQAFSGQSENNGCPSPTIPIRAVATPTLPVSASLEPGNHTTTALEPTTQPTPAPEPEGNSSSPLPTASAVGPTVPPQAGPMGDQASELDLSMLLQIPDVEPMFGNGGPYGDWGLPTSFEDLFLSYPHY